MFHAIEHLITCLFKTLKLLHVCRFHSMSLATLLEPRCLKDVRACDHVYAVAGSLKSYLRSGNGPQARAASCWAGGQGQPAAGRRARVSSCHTGRVYRVDESSRVSLAIGAACVGAPSVCRGLDAGRSGSLAATLHRLPEPES